MKFQKMQLLSAALLACLLACGPRESSARPAATVGAHRRVAVVASDLPPKLSDTLAVAKSPLEPITLAPSQPGARNDGESAATGIASASDEQHRPQHKQTTRAVGQADYEQQQSSTSTKGLDESTGLADSTAAGSTLSVVATELPEGAESGPTTTTEASAVTETETKASEGEQSEPTTTTALPLPPSSSTMSPVREEDADKPSETPTTTTTTEAPTMTTTTTSMPTTTTEKRDLEVITVAEPITTTTTTTTTSAPVPTTQESTTSAPVATTTSTLAPIEVSSEAVTEESSAQPTTTTTTTTPAPEPEAVITTTSAPDLQREQAPATTTSAPLPTTTAENTTTVSSVEPIAEPVTTTTTTITAKPTVAPEDEEAKLSACDHLPTYKSEEVQKVFREETTFKNGTIKGKFTYINFDQRYRLVHYTRLPYGPVKIDHVEELGRPKQGEGQNQSSATTINEVPNAVLQLRNLLPNSLFGFPFLGPNSAGQVRPTAIGPKEGTADGDVDKSNMYFYSTDSLATPNLLTPRVPVSLLPGQRVRLAQTTGANSAAAAAVDPLGSIYMEHSLAASAPRQGHEQQSANHSPQMSSIFGMPSGPIDPSSSPFSKSEEFLSDISRGGQRNHNQFHYANMMDARPETKSLAYSYYSSNAHPVHYQYAPLSSSLFGNPLYQAQHSPVESQGMMQPSSQLMPHQAHQPHSHEHYMSQYMLTSPAVVSSEPAAQDNARLRLRVKTSKALNVNRDSGTKSAQLRMQPSDGHYSAPAVESPMQILHQRNQHRRLGKQNHQLKSTSANQSPVVYHVLRNPVGRSLSQYNQGYAVAYDHDN